MQSITEDGHWRTVELDRRFPERDFGGMVLPEGHVARRLRITGRVQRVSYRFWTIEVARSLGLDGWVRNRLDGSVEVLAVGPDGAVGALIERCRRGPVAARVDRVDVETAIGIVPAGFTKMPTV